MLDHVHRVDHREPALLGESEQIDELRRAVRRVADIPVHVVVAGESGTGKELIARCLHRQSSNSSRPFTVVTCRATSGILLESEIFGHDLASHVGVPVSQIGKLEYANGGTVFLKHVECLPASVQARLAFALQENRVCRLGSSEPIDIAVRVVASTRADLKALCETGEFLSELYYTLCSVEIQAPPLRDMRSDIPLLFHEFLLQAASRYRRSVPTSCDDFLPELFAHSWPGNVRELRNFVERVVIGTVDMPCPAPAKSLTEQVDQFERQLILHQLRKHQGSVAAVSEQLLVPKTTLYDKLHKHGISSHSFK